MSNPPETKRYTRSSSRRRVLDVDLNAAPPCESRDQEDAVPNHTGPQNRQDAEGNSTLPPPIDVVALDDDVIISSPTAFSEAKNNSRRNRGQNIVVDVDNDERTSRNKRRGVSTSQTIINCDLYINLERDSNSMRESGQHAEVPPAPPASVKEATFSCPVCMGTLVEEMTTKCGHIFCKACIKAAIAAQGKCPTCRKKTTSKDIIRVYLPPTTTS